MMVVAVAVVKISLFLTQIAKMFHVISKLEISAKFHDAVSNMTQTDLAVTFIARENNFALLNKAEIHTQFKKFVSFAFFCYLKIVLILKSQVQKFNQKKRSVNCWWQEFAFVYI